MMHVARVVVASTSFAAVPCVTGCPAGDCTSAEPLYAGEATDEAWREMLDARIDAVEGGDAATFVAPAANVAIAAGISPEFAWESPLKVASTSHAPLLLSTPRRARASSFFDRLSAAVFPAARAHLPPITSDVYFLEIDVPGRTCPVAALTTETSFRFSDGDWQNVVDGNDDGSDDPGTRTARLMSAFLTENNVTEGPFLATPLSFTIEP